jgi:anti-sigma regulatory factor (Ser/Thr protein kinase)
VILEPAAEDGYWKSIVSAFVHSGTGEGMRETSTAPLIGWSRAFPATPTQIRRVREFLAGLLDDHPAADDAILCLSELATNATLHSRSREPGGSFQVSVERHGRHVRVEVTDQGGPWQQQPSGDDQNGRGLLVVARLAQNWGRTGDEHTGWTIWFEIEAQ